jgi:hypothetical protein
MAQCRRFKAMAEGTYRWVLGPSCEARLLAMVVRSAFAPSPCEMRLRAMSAEAAREVFRLPEARLLQFVGCKAKPNASPCNHHGTFT